MSGASVSYARGASGVKCLEGLELQGADDAGSSRPLVSDQVTELNVVDVQRGLLIAHQDTVAPPRIPGLSGSLVVPGTEGGSGGGLAEDEVDHMVRRSLGKLPGASVADDVVRGGQHLARGPNAAEIVLPSSEWRHIGHKRDLSVYSCLRVGG